MPIVDTILHVHEREGSHDSRTPAGEMVETYRSMSSNPVAVGFVGHDEEVHVAAPGVITIPGAEYSKTPGPNGVHIVKLPNAGLRILAHPGRTWPEDTKANAMRAVDKYRLDGVEKYTAGKKQYSGNLPTLEVSGDDCHSPPGAGFSYLRVNADGLTEDAVCDALSRGDFDMVNRRPPHRLALHALDRVVVSAVSRTPLLRFV